MRVRLTLSYLAVVLLAMGVAANLAWQALDRAFLDVLRENQAAQARRVAQAIESSLPATPPAPSPTLPPDGGLGANDAPPPLTDPVAAIQGVSPITRHYTPELSSTAPVSGSFANVLFGIHSRLVDEEGEVLLGEDAVQWLRCRYIEPAGERVGEDPLPESGYAQSANVLPGYHTHLLGPADALLATADEGAYYTVVEPADPPAAGQDTPVVEVPRISRDYSVTPPYALVTELLPWSTRPADTGSPAWPVPAGEAAALSAGRDGAVYNVTVPRDGGSPLSERPEVRSALTGQPATFVRSYDWAAERRVLYAAHPVRSPAGDVESVAYIASPIPRFSLSLLPAAFGPQVLGGAAVAVLLAGAAGVLLARRLTRPLQRLTAAAGILAEGGRPSPLPPAPSDELNRLGEAFNTMSARLATAYETLAAQARQREAILHHLADAVLAADASGEIILANPAASDLLAVASRSLGQAIDHTLRLGAPHATEIATRDRVVELVITPQRDDQGRVSGAVAVGHDVTAYRQLDRLRTNFVSDVSHELRTPLTAIKGFIETLQDGAADDPDTRDRFLGTVAIETERLIRLTNDLLLLTRADAGQLSLHRAPTDLVAVARRVVAQMRSRARRKGVTLSVDPPATPRPVLADADRVHQVLVNLVHNGLKFTPEGGRVTLTFDVSGTEGQIACTVADTGPGIPATEIPHLFERFYRGDRARARSGEENGSGLGLAIVKAIVETHAGHVWVESKPGHGAAFTFTLPQA